MRPSSLPSTCARIVDSNWFTGVVFAAILINAAALGAETYEGFAAQNRTVLNSINDGCLGVFVVELLIRIAAFGSRPQGFFRSGWNVFDFAVIGASFVPGVGQSTTVLRLARLARVVRLVRILPDLRVLLVAVGRSIPPIASIAALAVLVVYVYGIVGWLLFGNEIPDRWGNIGTAMLNLFVMLSLENLPENLEAGTRVHPWSWIFFVSFALMASFLLLNLLIGIVINSMEEARRIEHARERSERRALLAASGESDAELEEDEDARLAQKIAALRDSLEELEDELSARGRQVIGPGAAPRSTR